MMGYSRRTHSLSDGNIIHGDNGTTTCTTSNATFGTLLRIIAIVRGIVIGSIGGSG